MSNDDSNAYPEGFLPEEEKMMKPKQAPQRISAPVSVLLEAKAEGFSLDSFELEPLLQWFRPMQPHLQELRSRLLICVLTWLALSGAIALAYTPMWQHLKGLAPAGYSFVQLYPGELLIVTCKLVLVGGLTLASPMLGYHSLRFVLPGLTPKEKRLLLGLSLMAALFLFVGLALCWWVLLPLSLKLLLSFGSDLAAYQLSVARYVDFVLFLLMGVALLCVVPLALVGLIKLKAISVKQVLQRWKLGLVVAFALSAIITPTQDPLTMLLMAAVMLVFTALALLLAQWL
jgi:sec-independent protein translocase protein TatC